jgi:hypothetical protein
MRLKFHHGSIIAFQDAHFTQITTPFVSHVECRGNMVKKTQDEIGSRRLKEILFTHKKIHKINTIELCAGDDE